MKWTTLLIFGFLCLGAFNATAQLELSTGYAVNKNLADGAPLHIAYDVNIRGRWYTKPQIGYKYLYHFNDFVGAVLKVNIFEYHQTVSYEVVKRRKFIFKPNVGLNYRFYHWRGEMKPPLNSYPQRAYHIEFRDDRLRLNSFAPTTPTDGNYSDTYTVHNLGYSIQLQTQFKISGHLWLHVTPFVEPDYDRTQNTGGCYVGIILKNTTK